MLKAIKTSKCTYTGRVEGEFAQLLREIPTEERLGTLQFGYIEGKVFTLIGMVGVEQLNMMLAREGKI